MTTNENPVKGVRGRPRKNPPPEAGEARKLFVRLLDEHIPTGETRKSLCEDSKLSPSGWSRFATGSKSVPSWAGFFRPLTQHMRKVHAAKTPDSDGFPDEGVWQELHAQVLAEAGRSPEGGNGRNGMGGSIRSAARKTARVLGDVASSAATAAMIAVVGFGGIAFAVWRGLSGSGGGFPGPGGDFLMGVFQTVAALYAGGRARDVTRWLLERVPLGLLPARLRIVVERQRALLMTKRDDEPAHRDGE